MTRKATILTLAALLAAGTATLAPTPAMAGADGRRNTTIALGAAAVYELFQHKTTNALILGAGTAYAEKQYENARSNERDQNNNRRYYRSDSGYYDNNGRSQNGNRHDGWNRGNDDSRNNRGQDTYSDNHNRQDGHNNWQDSDRDNRDRRTDQRGAHRGWDGRSLPAGQDRNWVKP